MATIVLSAVGAAAGASIGGGVLGLSSVVIGRAVGASVGRVLDQRILGAGSEAIETGRVDRFRLTGASEGSAITQVYGRMRVPGQVIWASKFSEIRRTTGGSGKGSRPTPAVTEFAYTVSLAIALCEGTITRVGRVWADGQEVARDDLNMRVYSGASDQMPDSKIEAVEGTGNVPAFRGTAYVVMEDLPLAQFGNRIPQFSFEIMRPAQSEGEVATDPAFGIPGVALIPGTGEYSLATEPVYFERGPGDVSAVNMNSPSGKSDFETSYEALSEELPNCGAVSVVVSWFGDDLRCDQAQIRPKVEQVEIDGKGQPWRVAGISRSEANTVPQIDDRPVYGGTPSDASVIQAIERIRGDGKAVNFYPFILMDQVDGNGMTDPWTGNSDQPVLPWRGRMTVSLAPGQIGSPDQTVDAEQEVSLFMGTAQASDFSMVDGSVYYSGPDEWSYRRFILHCAHVCATAGGVESFCIGSEMRGMTQIRGANNAFPFVDALIALAADVRSVLGEGTDISYAADWSEYFGYHPQDGSGDVFFNLDPLWANENVDFIGIDNYMPMSDWRDGDDHLDAVWRSIYNLDYLKSNIAGGEGFDWYYRSAQAEAHQQRSPIEDGAYGEPWVFRYKDIKGWWSNEHHERVGGVRVASSTPWVPESKPIRFTEFGCAAIDKGTNQPNKFLDAKSSESSLPKYSDGRRDDLLQMQYLAATLDFWSVEENNPTSNEYGAPMLDMAGSYLWAWDARPYPFFPLNTALWSDGPNYFKGHWLNGRSSSRSLADVVAEICTRSGVNDVDVSRLYGYLRGYTVSDVAGARAALQPLMLAFGFEAIEREGQLIFRNRDGKTTAIASQDDLALTDDLAGAVEQIRQPEAEIAGRVRLSFVDADGDYDIRSEEAVFPDETSKNVAQSEIPVLMNQAEGRGTVERWLAEARVAKDSVNFAMPPSGLSVGAGDVVDLEMPEGIGSFRIDRVTDAHSRTFEAVRVESETYEPSVAIDLSAPLKQFEAPAPVYPVFLDLPLLSGEEVPYAPHLAVATTTWPGSVSVFSSAEDNGYTFNSTIHQAAIVGVTQSPLLPAKSGMIDRGLPLRVRLTSGNLGSVSMESMLNGGNVAAIGDGTPGNWEILQFEAAEVVGSREYDISGRIRGQAGTNFLSDETWPSGSTFVLLDGSVRQINVSASARGLERHFRIGPSRRPYDDPSYVHLSEAFDGIGLRPYSPVHLRTRTDALGNLDVQWIRRTRIDGDSWLSSDVPLGEDLESYDVRVMAGGDVVRETTVSAPNWTYTAAAKSDDGIVGPFEIWVSQLSARFGAGPYSRIDING